jgi:hypothetical protein
MLHTHLHVTITLITRTSGRSLGTLTKQCFFWNIVEHRIENYYHICDQCECLNLQINEGITQITYLVCGHGPGMTQLNGQKIPIANREKYLSVLSLTNITWRIHAETKQANILFVMKISSSHFSVA